MKLRNKKTGIRGCIEYVMRTINPITGEPLLTVRYKDNSGITCYKDYETIEGFNEDWEDYKQTEPLIKDEKIRKAVRAWADAVGAECVEITHSRSHFIRFMSHLANEDELCISREIGQIFKEELFTIEELCGEEEEK